MKHLSKLFHIVGLFIIILSTARWWSSYYDSSQFGLGVLIGIVICGFGFLIGWMTMLIEWMTMLIEWMTMEDMEMNNLEKRLDSLVVEVKNLNLLKK